MLKILDERQIKQKIKRLAIHILENNFDQKKIILAGINNNGLGFAKLLLDELNSLKHSTDFILTGIRLNPAKPLSEDIEVDMPLKELSGQAIIIIDDVANTGRTIFYAMKPLMNILPKKLEVAVLVDRKHKSFPIKVDYVGLSLATTMRENIDVQIAKVKEQAVYLN